MGNKITLADLAPAKEVMRMIKRKQLASQQARTRAAAACRARLMHAMPRQGRASGAHDDAEVIE